LLAHLDYLDSQLEAFSARSDQGRRPHLSDEGLDRLDEVPGVKRQTIEKVVAESGVDRTPFADAEQLSWWAGVCPGPEASAGKRQRSRTTQGNRWRKRALTEVAWAASRCQDSYLGAQYRRLAGRRGKKRALLAVGPGILVILDHLLKSRWRTKTWERSPWSTGTRSAEHATWSSGWRRWATK
jgi:transposase